LAVLRNFLTGIIPASANLASEGRPKNSDKVSGLIKNPASHFGKLFGVGEKYVEQARELQKDDALSFDVVKGGASLKRRKPDNRAEAVPKPT
jgi:hypothetical protein